MTRNEAKEILQAVKFLLPTEAYSDTAEEALDMAIEALEQYENAFEHGYTEAESKYREILERKHGEWIESDFGWKCSICGNTSVMWQRTYNFCPNCGADMRGDKDE